MIALISDIHGNFPALCSVLEKIDSLGVTEILCLGDTAGYYSQVNECCDELRARGIYSLMGNHDWYIAANAPCPRSNSANDCLEYQRKVISENNMEWLKTLRPQGEVKGIKLAHGGWNNPLDEYFRPSDEYFSIFEGILFASGHTHIPVIWTNGQKTYCNPGSVGQPRDGNPEASFAILENGTFTNVRVPYDIAETQRAMADAGFSDYYYRNLSVGARIGGKIDALSGGSV